MLLDTDIPLSSHVGEPITTPLKLETPIVAGDTKGPGEVTLRLGLASAS